MDLFLRCCIVISLHLRAIHALPAPNAVATFDDVNDASPISIVTCDEPLRHTPTVIQDHIYYQSALPSASGQPAEASPLGIYIAVGAVGALVFLCAFGWLLWRGSRWYALWKQTRPAGRRVHICASETPVPQAYSTRRPHSGPVAPVDALPSQECTSRQIPAFIQPHDAVAPVIQEASPPYPVASPAFPEAALPSARLHETSTLRGLAMPRAVSCNPDTNPDGRRSFESSVGHSDVTAVTLGSMGGDQNDLQPPGAPPPYTHPDWETFDGSETAL